jgi:hypothetical protein
MSMIVELLGLKGVYLLYDCFDVLFLVGWDVVDTLSVPSEVFSLGYIFVSSLDESPDIV